MFSFARGVLARTVFGRAPRRARSDQVADIELDMEKIEAIKAEYQARRSPTGGPEFISTSDVLHSLWFKAHSVRHGAKSLSGMDRAVFFFELGLDVRPRFPELRGDGG